MAKVRRKAKDPGSPSRSKRTATTPGATLKEPRASKAARANGAKARAHKARLRAKKAILENPDHPVNLRRRQMVRYLMRYGWGRDRVYDQLCSLKGADRVALLDEDGDFPSRSQIYNLYTSIREKWKQADDADRAEKKARWLENLADHMFELDKRRAPCGAKMTCSCGQQHKCNAERGAVQALAAKNKALDMMAEVEGIKDPIRVEVDVEFTLREAVSRALGELNPNMRRDLALANIERRQSVGMLPQVIDAE